MIINPDIDLTPETARTLDRFRQLFCTGRFLWLAGVGAEALGNTDMAALYRVMDRVVLTAAGCQLCTVSDRLTPEQALAQAKDSLAELQAVLEQMKGIALEWYASQSYETQVAMLALLAALGAWCDSTVGSLPPETQAVLKALRELLFTLQGEAAVKMSPGLRVVPRDVEAI